jgi:hypothetical protein
LESNNPCQLVSASLVSTAQTNNKLTYLIDNYDGWIAGFVLQ